MNAIVERALRGENLSDVLIIDFHVHIASKWNGMNMVVHDSDEMIRLAQAVGVSKLAINSAILPDIGAGNDLVGDLARRYPDAVVGIAGVDPYQHDMAAEARRCFDELGMRGVKVHAMHQTYHSPRPISSFTRQWHDLLAFLSERRAPVLYHGAVTEEMIREWPDVPFVCAHGIYDIAGMERLAKYPNFHVDTAATQNPAWCVRSGAAVLGPERVLWGTDAPLDDFAQRLGVVLDSGLSEDDMRKILGLNSARLLGLDG